MKPASSTVESLRFHVPSMSCENDVDRLSKAIISVEAKAAMSFDRGFREVEIIPIEAGAAQFRAAIAGAGFCITR